MREEKRKSRQVSLCEQLAQNCYMEWRRRDLNLRRRDLNLRRRDLNLRPLGYKSDTLTTTPHSLAMT